MNSIAAVLFGQIHGLVGLVQYLLRFHGIIREGGDTGADGHLAKRLGLAPLERIFCDAGAYGFRNDIGTLFIGLREQQGKFLTPVTVGKIGLTQAALGDLGNDPQQAIAFHMAMGIVVFLEMIDIKED